MPPAILPSPNCCRRCCPAIVSISASALPLRCRQAGAGANTVVALKGVGSLFGFLKVKQVVDDSGAAGQRPPGRLLPRQLRKQQLPLARWLRWLELSCGADYRR